MGKKQEVIEHIFNVCKEKNDFVFDNNLVKDVCKKVGFGNPFDVTKIDNSSLLPDCVKDDNFFIVHIGKGYHRFVKGINIGYHKFEEILPEEIYDWKYRRSLLNELDTSESNILSVVNNQRIIHDFLYDDIVASPKTYNARRTKMGFEYYIGKQYIESAGVYS